MYIALNNTTGDEYSVNLMPLPQKDNIFKEII